MAPKKKTTDAQVMDEKRQQLEFLKRQCEAVEQLMMLVDEEKRCVEHEKVVKKKRIEELREQFEAAELKLDEQVRMMQHMSVTCEEQLRNRLKTLESKVAEVEQGNAALQLKAEEIRKSKKEELQRLKDGVVTLREQLETKALACGVKLRDVLLMQP